MTDVGLTETEQVDGVWQPVYSYGPVLGIERCKSYSIAPIVRLIMPTLMEEVREVWQGEKSTQ